VVVAVPVGAYIYLSTLDFETLKAEVEQRVEAATGRQLTLEGPVSFSIGLQPSVTIDQVSLANAEWGSQPEMVSLERFELELELMPLFSGDIQVNRAVLVGPDILLETAPDGRANWTLTGGADAPAGETEDTAQTGEGPAIPDIVALEIRDGRLVYRDGASGATQTVALESLTLSQLADGQEVALDASYQDTPISLAGTIGTVGEIMADTQFPLDLEGTVAGNAIAVSGVIQQPQTAPTPDLKIAVEGESLASFAPLAGGAEIPPLGPYSLEGRTVVDGQTYGLDALRLSLGETEMTGSLAADLSGERPRVVADLTASVIDLRDFQTGEGAAESDSAGSGSGAGAGGDSPYVIPDTPLPLDALGAADATVQLKAGILRVDPELELSDVVVGLDLSNGNLQVAPLEAGYQQSRLAGTVGLDASQETPRMTTALAWDEFDFGRMLNDQGLTDEVEGTMDIRIDLTGAGASPRALAASLDGTTEIVNDGGVISNKLLAIVGADFGDVLGPLLGDEDTTGLNCIVSRFDIADGLATSQALVVDTATFSVAGAGTVDLNDESLDLTFDTATRVPALVSLAIPFKVQGTLKDPNVVPDPAGALKGLAGAAGSIGNPLEVLGGIGGDGGVEGALSGILGGGQNAEQPAEGETQTAANPCLIALDPEAQAAVGAEEPASEPAVPNPVEDVGQAVQDAAEEPQRAIEEGVNQLRNLFGD
jgi:hypothetical protein